MGKQIEGDSKQRRAAAREAGSTSREHGLTTGGSKQRTHVKGSVDHDEKLETIQSR